MKRLFIKTISYCLLALGTVVFTNCEKDSNIKQYVYPAPEVSGYSPAAGYVKSRVAILRSEERRVGKECRSRWSPYH